MAKSFISKSFITLLLLLANPAASKKLLFDDANGNDAGEDAGGGYRIRMRSFDAHFSDGMTRTEKLQRAIKWSKARAHALIKKHGGNDGRISPYGYQSPLVPAGGGYVMEIDIGTPSQVFQAIADTGSDLVWVQSQPCISCNGTIFNPAASSTYKPVACSSPLCKALPVPSCNGNSCNYIYQYGSGTTLGQLGSDTVTLASATPTSGAAVVAKHKFGNVAIGGGTFNYGFNGLEGIVGLGQGPLSLTSQLSSAIDKKFSYCLVDILDPSKSSPLLFGDAAVIKGSGVKSTPIVPSQQYPTYYLLDAEGITVNGKSLGSPGNTIIDSGTTLTLVDQALYTKIKDAFSASIQLPTADGSSIGLDLCYNVSSNKNYIFPSLSLQLKGATLAPPQANYFLTVDDSGETVCLAMGTAQGLPVSIIGNVMHQNYHVLYDRGASVLSFVPAECDKLF